MAAAAAQYADHTVITNENPRSEDPVEMVEEIAGHFIEAGGGSFDKQPDRRQAIQRAVSLAQPDDLVLIAGKGAEPTLIYADRTEPWDDRSVAREVLNSLDSLPTAIAYLSNDPAHTLLAIEPPYLSEPSNGQRPISRAR